MSCTFEYIYRVETSCHSQNIRKINKYNDRLVGLDFVAFFFNGPRMT